MKKLLERSCPYLRCLVFWCSTCCAEEMLGRVKDCYHLKMETVLQDCHDSGVIILSGEVCQGLGISKERTFSLLLPLLLLFQYLFVSVFYFVALQFTSILSPYLFCFVHHHAICKSFSWLSSPLLGNPGFTQPWVSCVSQQTSEGVLYTPSSLIGCWQ